MLSFCLESSTKGFGTSWLLLGPCQEDRQVFFGTRRATGSGSEEGVFKVQPEWLVCVAQLRTPLPGSCPSLCPLLWALKSCLGTGARG